MILSIDQGTTGTTVLLVNRQARVVAHAYAELPQHYPRPGWVEHRPEDILQVTDRVIKRALANGRIAPRHIRAISLQAGASGWVATDLAGDLEALAGCAR